MSTILVDNLTGKTSAGSITVTSEGGAATQSLQQGLCKVWVNFNGTGTVAIRASFNVSSITDNGTGDYTVNFTTAMPDANYAAMARGSITSAAGSGNLDDDHVIARSLTTTTTTLECSNSSATKVNFAEVYLAVFR